MKFKCNDCNKVIGGFGNVNKLSPDRINLTTKEILELNCQYCDGAISPVNNDSISLVEGAITYKDGTSKDFRDRMSNIASSHKGFNR